MVPRILIVEDEPLIALDLVSSLEAAGFEPVGVARDMADALRIAEDQPIDLATMDVQLACGSDGVETARILRERHGIPCVFVSSSLDAATRARAVPARPIGFIDKPMVSDEVAAFVTDHFRTERPAG